MASTTYDAAATKTHTTSGSESKYQTIKSAEFNKVIETYTGQTLSGRDFNALIGSEPMIKFTTDTENHNGFQLKTGLNIDTKPFYNKGSCSRGGIYFTSLYNFHLWSNYGSKQCVQFRYVTVPDDAKVYIERSKFKADRIVLSDPQPFNSVSQLWTDPRYYTHFDRTSYNAQNIPYVMNERFNMPEEYYMAFTKTFPTFASHIAPKFLKNKEFRMKLYDLNSKIFSQLTNYRDSSECLDAIGKYPAIYRELTTSEKVNHEIYTAALAADPMMLSSIHHKSQTSDICQYAFSHNPATFQFINPTFYRPEMYLPAVTANPSNFKLIPFGEQTDEIIMAAVEKDGMMITHADYQTYPIAHAAIKQHGVAYQYVENQRPLTIVREADGTTSQMYDDSLIELAIQTHPRAVLHMKTFVEAPITKAIEKDHTIIFDMRKTTMNRWITKPMKEILFRRDLKSGFETFPDFHPSESILRDAIDIDRKNVSYIPSTYKYSRDFAEYIYNEFPNMRSRVIEYMPREYHENLINEDPLAALFSDSTMRVAEDILG